MVMKVAERTKALPWQLFPTRVRSANEARRGLPFIEVADPQKSSVMTGLLQRNPTESSRVIYIHIPFCTKECTFCMYHKQIDAKPQVVQDYIHRVLSHIESVSSMPWVSSAPFSAVYFGGGTPTSIPTKYIETIMGSLRENIPLTEDCEVTVESTVSEVNSSNLSQLKGFGVNRISLGVQSFSNAVRESLGRSTSTQDVIKKFELIANAGIDNVCLDLIYGLQGQTLSDWQNDLDTVAKIPVAGCSVYPIIGPAGAMANRREDYRFEFDCFVEADSKLVEIPGWARFTPVQYGHSVKGRAAYVTAHGQSADLLAFGSGAGGRIDEFLYFSTPDVNRFINGSESLQHSPMRVMALDSKILDLRRIFALSERLELQQKDYQQLQRYFKAEIQNLEQLGLVEQTTAELSLTQLGRFWAGNISAVFANRIAEILGHS